MFYHLNRLVRSFAAAARGAAGSRPGPRRPFRVEVLTDFLRRTLHLALAYEASRIRSRERPMPIRRSLRRRLELERIEVAGLDTFVAAPVEGPCRGELLYLHGGGYGFCSTATHRALITRLAAVCGVRCVAPNYRLAPEHPFPAAVDDALAVYRARIEGGADREGLSIGGDSAGGGLALATLLRLRESGETLPRSAVLLSPWVDLTSSGASVTGNAPYDYLSYELLQFHARNYLGATPPTDPLASPLFADLRGLPPLLVQAGGAETLLSEGRELARRAEAAGVDVTLQVWEGAIHVFQFFAPIVPEAVPAIRAVRDFLDRPSRFHSAPDPEDRDRPRSRAPHP